MEVAPEELPLNNLVLRVDGGEKRYIDRGKKKREREGEKELLNHLSTQSRRTGKGQEIPEITKVGKRS